MTVNAANLTDLVLSGKLRARGDVATDDALQSNLGVLFLYDLVSRFVSVRVGTFDPSVSGEPGVKGSVFLRVDVPQIWQKQTDTPDTAWSLIAAGGGTSTFALTPAITPATIAGGVNNYAPTGASTHSRWRQGLTADAALSGIVAISDGFVVVIENLSATFRLRLEHEDAASTAANRFSLPSQEALIVDPLGSVVLVYDVTSARWKAWSTATNTIAGLDVVTADLTVTDANAHVVAGDVVVDVGDVHVLAGSVTVDAGDVSAITGTVLGAQVGAVADLATTGALHLAGVISPAAITGAHNNYAPTGIGASTTLRQALTGAASLTGIVAGTSGQLLAVENLDPALTLSLTNEDAASTAANRILTPNGVQLDIPPEGAALLLYDTTSSRWRVVAGPAPAASSGGGAGLYGDGSDGDVVIAVNTALTRDMFYNTLIVNTGVSLDPAGFRIFALVSITLTGTGKITGSGGNAVAGVGGTVTGGGTLPNGNPGGNGGTFASGSGGAPGGKTPRGYSGAGGAAGAVGGAGGGGGGGGNSAGSPGGGGGGGGTAFTAAQGDIKLAINAINGLVYGPPVALLVGGPATPGTTGGGGGGGGANGGAVTGAVGGGGGASGRYMVVASPLFLGTGSIVNDGGAGAAGFDDLTGSAGGGAGGGGGFTVIVRAGGVAPTTSVAGGAGGAGAGAGSAAGGNGGAGVVQSFVGV